MKRSIAFLSVLICFFCFNPSLNAQDRDLDNDGQWDYGSGGTDRDLDNDGQWDNWAGGTDRDIDNDGQWDQF